jgi:hypothetical protein
MPSMRNMDSSQGHAGRDASEGVREPAQVHYPRKRRENWPFKFYQENGRMYQNTVPRRKTDPLADAEPAPW